MGRGDRLLLTAGQFNREVARERVRAIRRSIPFCVLTIELKGREHRRRRSRLLVRLLHRHLRMTDHKAMLGRGKYGVLLVDTPEMGGRSAIQRIIHLAQQQNLKIEVRLQVHDPGIDGDGDGEPPSDGQRRRDDEPSQRWLRVDNHVHISAEDPLVPPPMLQMIGKRVIDIVGAGLGLLITGPILLAAMAAIKWHDSGPAIFKQTREGFSGKPFTIYKLRTMVMGAEESQSELLARSHRDGPAFKVADDPRVTPVGRPLRKYCVDELPQLWNVLKGEMSLVGPRPLPWHESRACQGWQRRRLEVRPGLTCDWQIDKTRVTTFDDWMRLDLRYVDGIGLMRDLRLIARTVLVPFHGRGSE